MPATDLTGQTVLTTKRHFQALDGLRGVAALVIVIFHFMEMVIYDYSIIPLGHGFLAVDFFFCLSGFVIAYAYDDRIRSMGALDFIKARLIRLHPLVILGSVLGLITLLLDPFHHGPLGLGAGQLGLVFLASLLLIPYPVMKERAFNLFTLNAPAWSLFWEYVANLLYLVVLARLRRGWLIAATLVAAIALCFAGYRAGTLPGGWGGSTFWDGAARVSFSFLAGMLVFRSRWIIPSRLGFGSLAFLLLLTFFMPYSAHGWLREALVIIFFYPLLIALGAGADLTPRSKKFCTFAGNLSYPLYMTHYCAIWIFHNFVLTHKPTVPQLAIVIPAGVLLLLGLGYLTMVFYDVPVRTWLRAHFSGTTRYRNPAGLTDQP